MSRKYILRKITNVAFWGIRNGKPTIELSLECGHRKVVYRRDGITLNASRARCIVCVNES